MRPVSSLSSSQITIETKAVRRRRRLHSFRPQFRRQIEALTSASVALEDLADSFPALLFALATGYGTAAARAAALHAIGRGANLRECAAAAGLSWWMRKLPADALSRPFAALPSDPEFSLAMLGRVPDGPAECAAWLDRAMLAHEISGRDTALWLAREPRMLPPLTSEDDLHWALAWAWASRHPESPGYGLLRGRWTPSTGWKRARDEIAIWRKRIDLVGALAGSDRDPWFQDAQVKGLSFVHLATVDDFVAEADAMENCLDQYAAHLAYGRVRVFSVRRDGKPVADVELTLRSDETAMPCISQIRGPRNRRASPAIWQTVHAWLGSQPFRPLAAVATSSAATREAVKAFWKPYQAAIAAAGLQHRLVTPVGSRDARRSRGRPAALRPATGRSEPPDAPDLIALRPPQDA